MVSDEGRPEASCNDARECKITEREDDNPEACGKTAKEVSSSHYDVITSKGDGRVMSGKRERVAEQGGMMQRPSAGSHSPMLQYISLSPTRQYRCSRLGFTVIPYLTVMARWTAMSQAPESFWNPLSPPWRFDP